jgi:hypothetical protein
MRLRMLILPAVASVALLAGCTTAPTPEPTPTETTNGVEDLEADEILQEARDALTQAESVHVEGTITEGDVTFSLDLVYSGANVEGVVDVFGVSAEVVKVGADVYVKADTSLFAQFLPAEQQQMLALMEGKWVKVNQSLAVMFIPGVPLGVGDYFTFTEPLEKGEVSTVDGTQVITVTDADGAEVQVAIEGEPYPLAIVMGDEGFTFSEFDKNVSIEAPDAEDVLDVMALLGLG